MFPLHNPAAGGCSCGSSECKSVAKHPRTSRGLRDASTDEATIQGWWKRWPDANIGLRTDGLCVLDVDVKGDVDGLKTLEGLGVDLSSVPVAKTGSGGRHYFFSATPKPVRNTAGFRPGLDIRGAGGYVVAAPSLHSSGGRYEWLVEDIPEVFPPVPEWLLRLLEKPQRPADQNTAPAPQGPRQALLGRGLAYLAKCAPATEGSRNDTGFRLAGNLFALEEDGARLSEDEVFHLMGSWNLGNSPPLPEDELRQVIGSALRNGTPREPKPGLSSPATATEWSGKSLGHFDQVKPETAPPEWADIQPFEEEAGLPEFPTEALPEILGRWVEAQTEALQVPRALPGMLSLVVVASAIAKKTRIHGMSGWVEPANLYVSPILEPGNRKSAAFREAAAPLLEAEKNLIETKAPEVARESAERRLAEKRLASLEKKLADKPSDDLKQEALELAERLALWPEPVLPRLVCDDVTPERLAVLLAEQGGKMASLSAEGNVFSNMAGRYQAGRTEFDVYLKGHSGDFIRVDRMGRPSLMVPSPSLCCGYAIQSEVLRGLPHKAAFLGTGLLARFLYALPESPIGSRKARPEPIPEEVTEAYRRLILDLVEDSEERELWLSFDAEEAFVSYFEEVERELGPGGTLEPIREWGGKLCGAVLRIAGGLHLAKRNISELIEVGTIREAVKIGRFLVPHALAVFRLIEGLEPSGGSGGRYVLAWVKRHGRREFSEREMRDHCRKVDDPETAKAALEELQNRHYIRRIPKGEPSGPGRPHSETFQVNPAFFESETPGTLSENSVYSQPEGNFPNKPTQFPVVENTETAPDGNFPNKPTQFPEIENQTEGEGRVIEWI